MSQYIRIYMRWDILEIYINVVIEVGRGERFLGKNCYIIIMNDN